MKLPGAASGDLFGSLPDPPRLPNPSRSRAFDGDTYEPDRDHDRLRGQLSRVAELMKDGRWRTLENIAAETGGSIPAISARLRDLRKEKYGARTVERRHIKEGLFEYRVAP